VSGTGADYIVAALEQAGVKRVYGVVGDSLNGLPIRCAGAAKSSGCICGTRRVPRFAAAAEAHLTGQLAVCAAAVAPVICI